MTYVYTYPFRHVALMICAQRATRARDADFFQRSPPDVIFVLRPAPRAKAQILLISIAFVAMPVTQDIRYDSGATPEFAAARTMHAGITLQLR